MTYILLNDVEHNTWLEFCDIVRIVSTAASAEVSACLHRVQEGVEQGLYAAGFVSYEAGAAFHGDALFHTSAAMPLVWFALCRRVNPVAPPQTDAAAIPLAWKPECAYPEYTRKIENIHSAIAGGETYQVNFTYALQSSTPADFDPWRFFCALQQRQGGKYAAYVDTGSHVVCSASPELFFRVDHGSISARPMKGTAPRGRTPALDADIAARLRSCEKNRAENLMIVDMLRNDMGRIAAVGSVRVHDLFRLEKYPSVWQMVSTVSAHLKPGCTLVDQFRSLFPCASITGAPKRQTLKWIRDLEAQARGLYTGSIGFLTPAGRSQFNVAIRTAVFARAGRTLRYGVGGGIVWDSTPEDEWEETRTKSMILPGFGNFSLLETLLWTPHQGFRNFAYHLERVHESARFFAIPLDISRLRQEMINAASRQQLLCRRRVRCLIDQRGRFTIQFFPHPPEQGGKPVRVALAPQPVHSSDVTLRHKTDRRRRYTELLEQCPHADDVLLYNERGEITESTIANVVVFLKGKWLTPPLECGLLPGTMRRRLLDCGRIQEQVVTLEDIHKAQIYLLNSLRGWRYAVLLRT